MLKHLHPLVIALIFFAIPTFAKQPQKEHLIRYELKGDTVTVKRKYVSEWKVDKATLERIPLSYDTLQTYSYHIPKNGYSLDYLHEDARAIVSKVDSTTNHMVKTGLYSDYPSINIVANDTVSFSYLYYSIFARICYELGSHGVMPINPDVHKKSILWKDIAFDIDGGIQPSEITAYFHGDEIRLRVYSSDTTFDEVLTPENAALLPSLFPQKTKNNRIHGQRILIATNGLPCSVSKMMSLVELLSFSNALFSFNVRGERDWERYSPTDSLDYQHHTGQRTMIGKPIIYLYPEKETEISVKVDPSVRFTFTYPTYPDSGWRVRAQPNGDIKDLSTGKEYYSLFWEGRGNYTCDFSEGFVVAKEEVILFLEEKLSILGLNYRERQEFIVYWAPVLEQNGFSAVHFATEEYNKAVPLIITPKPQTLIRVLMSFKKVDASWMEPGDFETSVDGQRGINEQYLKPIIRKGYTVVEWGGSNYDTDSQVLK